MITNIFVIVPEFCSLANVLQLQLQMQCRSISDWLILSCQKYTFSINEITFPRKVQLFMVYYITCFDYPFPSKLSHYSFFEYILQLKEVFTLNYAITLPLIIIMYILHTSLR